MKMNSINNETDVQPSQTEDFQVHLISREQNSFSDALRRTVVVTLSSAAQVAGLDHKFCSFKNLVIFEKRFFEPLLNFY